MKKIRCFIAVFLAALVLFSVPASVQAQEYDPKAPNCHITYDFGGGNTFDVTNATAKLLCVTAADGSYVTDPGTGMYQLDPWKVLAFLQNLADMYPVKSGVLYFAATRGETVTIPSVNAKSGNFDLASELNYLYQAILEQRTETHSVAVNTYSVGDTYIEVDLTNQMLYHYVNGAKVQETSIVTGNTSTGNGTPSGVFQIRNKVRDTYLTGKDYKAFVSYWMPFIGNSYGVHDANWRSRFGGTIYQTAGSHGCVNIPPAIMPALYESTTIGTPVIIFS